MSFEAIWLQCMRAKQPHFILVCFAVIKVFGKINRFNVLREPSVGMVF